MDNMDCNKTQPAVRKVKKKHVKDELDRQKQAEKKKRRLEKALATSAAIISELEKKKQKKREEQKKLDEKKGAAIAEAVALRVLIGEDSDDSYKIVLNKDEEYNHWDCSSNAGLFVGEQRNGFACQDSAKLPQRIQWITNTYRSGCTELSFSSGMYGNSDAWYFQEAGSKATGFSAALIAAHAVSSLQISEGVHDNTFMFNGMLRN